MRQLIAGTGCGAQLSIAARPLQPALPCDSTEIQIEIHGIDQADGVLVPGVNAAFDDAMPLQGVLGQAQATLNGEEQIRLVML
jgi:hypothetical protein